MAKRMAAAGGRVGKAGHERPTDAEGRQRRARRNRRAAMARARAGKAVRDEDRFAIYDRAVSAVLRSEGWDHVGCGDVEYIASQVRLWMNDRSVGYLPCTRTIRRHLARMELAEVANGQ